MVVCQPAAVCPDAPAGHRAARWRPAPAETPVPVLTLAVVVSAPRSGRGDQRDSPRQDPAERGCLAAVIPAQALPQVGDSSVVRECQLTVFSEVPIERDFFDGPALPVRRVDS